MRINTKKYRRLNFLLNCGILLCCVANLNAQTITGINTQTPQTTVEVKSLTPANPSNDTGLLIPRVENLNTTDAKERGLLVFYNAPVNEDKGLYWWDGNNWIPFTTTNQTNPVSYITYGYAEDSFAEGPMTESTATDVRTIDFESVATNDVGNFEIDNGDLLIHKQGRYYVEAVSYIEKQNTSDSQRRDGVDLLIYVNGANAAASDPDNSNLHGTTAFPVGGVGGNNAPTRSINIGGVLYLEENDRLSLRVEHFYNDDTPTGTTVQIDLNADITTNLSLRYLGDF